MVEVGIVRVSVADRRVAMPVGVGLAGRVLRRVRMLMVVVVHMTMLVFQRLVLMRVFVPFGEMQPDADAHQRSRRP